MKKFGDYISHRVYQKRKINFWTAIGYGVSDMVGGGGQTIIGAWLLFFYTTYCNLSATQGALIVAIGKVVSGTCGMLMSSACVYVLWCTTIADFYTDVGWRYELLVLPNYLLCF